MNLLQKKKIKKQGYVQNKVTVFNTEIEPHGKKQHESSVTGDHIYL